jgi:hypothetical protein
MAPKNSNAPNVVRPPNVNSFTQWKDLDEGDRKKHCAHCKEELPYSHGIPEIED